MATNQPLPNPDQLAVPEPAEPTPDLTAIQQRLQQQDTELQRLRTAVQNTPQFTAPPAPTTPPAADPKQELEASFWKDPLTMSAQIANRAAAEAAANQLAPHFDTLVEVAKSSVRAKDPQLFDRFLGEIEARVQQLAPQFRTNVGVWQGVFDAVKGAHTGELLREAQTTTAPTVRRPDGPAAPSSRAPAAPKVVALSAEESTFAKFLGLSEDSYRHGKEILENPDHWGQVITFDSTEKRRQQNAK